MNQYVQWSNEEKIKRTIKALEKNNMNGYMVNSKEEVIDKVKELIQEGDLVSCGGSVTLKETGVLDLLAAGQYKYLNRYKEGITQEEVKEVFRGAFSADAYFSSTNAITENGELYNVDGNGNRVAAMLYGPDKVIIIAGVNKIVKNVDEAIKRNREVSAPINAKKLNKRTPCAKVGYCMDCQSEDRICLEYTLIKKQRDKNRIHVILVNDSLGY